MFIDIIDMAAIFRLQKDEHLEDLLEAFLRKKGRIVKRYAQQIRAIEDIRYVFAQIFASFSVTIIGLAFAASGFEDAVLEGPEMLNKGDFIHFGVLMIGVLFFAVGGIYYGPTTIISTYKIAAFIDALRCVQYGDKQLPISIIKQDLFDGRYRPQRYVFVYLFCAIATLVFFAVVFLCRFF